jgi:hypothetical protein
MITNSPLPGARIKPKKAKSSPPADKDFLRLGKDHFAEDFPNPTRKGCPQGSTLELLANKPTEVEESVLTHISSCSPCYRTYSHFLQEQKRKAQSHS